MWTSVAGERDGENFYESSGYWEAPLGARTSFVAAPWVEQNYDTEDGWRGEATLSLKRAVYRNESAVMAVQAGALYLSHPGSECGEAGAEVRWLGGMNVGARSFVNVEAAGRVQEGGCGGERADITAGFRPRANWLGLAQVFVDTPHEGEDVVRAQFSVVRFGRSGRGIQIGVRARVDGEEQEPALVIGLWGKSGE